MYLSHNTEAYNCPMKIKLNTMVEELLPPEVREQETDQDLTEDSAENSQVAHPAKNTINKICAGLNTLHTVPTQLLTVSDQNGLPIHIELNSTATVNYISLDEAKARNFYISRNNQSSRLGDGDTTITACGEITTTFYRDNLPLSFQAIVCNKLHCPIIGRTVFIKNNSIKQDFTNTTIFTI